MPPYVVLHQGFHCLPKVAFNSIQNEKSKKSTYAQSRVDSIKAASSVYYISLSHLTGYITFSQVILLSTIRFLKSSD